MHHQWCRAENFHTTFFFPLHFFLEIYICSDYEHTYLLSDKQIWFAFLWNYFIAVQLLGAYFTSKKKNPRYWNCILWSWIEQEDLCSTMEKLIGKYD